MISMPYSLRLVRSPGGSGNCFESGKSWMR